MRPCPGLKAGQEACWTAGSPFRWGLRHLPHPLTTISHKLSRFLREIKRNKALVHTLFHSYVRSLTRRDYTQCYTQGNGGALPQTHRVSPAQGAAPCVHNKVSPLGLLFRAQQCIIAPSSVVTNVSQKHREKPSLQERPSLHSSAPSTRAPRKSPMAPKTLSLLTSFKGKQIPPVDVWLL